MLFFSGNLMEHKLTEYMHLPQISDHPKNSKNEISAQRAYSNKYTVV